VQKVIGPTAPKFAGGGWWRGLASDSVSRKVFGGRGPYSQGLCEVGRRGVKKAMPRRISPCTKGNINSSREKSD